MPEIGEIRYARELGFKSNPYQKYRWTPCIICGAPRWMTVTHFNKNQSMRCRHCGALGYGGDKNSRWKGGRIMDKGYVAVWIPKDSPFYLMATKHGYVREHRLVMAQMLGRCLQPFEYPHHKNGVRSDNRPANLEQTMHGANAMLHNKGYKDGYLRGLNDGRLAKIQKLEAMVKELEGRLGFFEVPDAILPEVMP